VATDNYEVVKSAYEHLKKKGLERFAFLGLPLGPKPIGWRLSASGPAQLL